MSSEFFLHTKVIKTLRLKSNKKELSMVHYTSNITPENLPAFEPFVKTSARIEGANNIAVPKETTMASLIIFWAGDPEPVVFTVPETLIPHQTGVITIKIPGVGDVKGNSVFLGGNLNPFTNQTEYSARFHASISNPNQED